MQLRQSEYGSVRVYGYIQEVPADIRRGADVRVRNRHGMVLLDLADRVRSAMELSHCMEERIYAKQGIFPVVQVRRHNTGVLRNGGELLIFLTILLHLLFCVSFV